jgi:HlyD family secretion protein
MVGTVVMALLVAASALYLRGTAPRRAAPPTLPAVTVGGQVVAEARVVPTRYVSLSLPAGGAVDEVLVPEGTRVQRGQVLVRLDTASQARAAVKEAEAAVTGAEARLAELRAGARAQEIEAARGTLSAARARYRQLLAGARAEEREQARMGVEQADAQARAAQQAVRQADANLEIAQTDLHRAEQLFRVGAVAQQVLEQARTRFLLAEAAGKAARAQLQVAEAQVASARQQQRLVFSGPRKEEIDAAAADVQRANAQLALLQAGSRQETVDAAAADVAAARARLRYARETLAQTELRAPFAGIVAAIVPTKHEFVAAGSPIVRLADASAWIIETTDLSDLSIARVREGDPVAITFDGIPGLQLAGEVIGIQGFGETKQGDIVYKVTIRPERQDPRFRWNMTATIAISPATLR